MENYIITFENTHTAMDGEDTLKTEGINLTIIPTPTYITKSCGISIRLNKKEYEKAKNIIDSGKIRIKNIYLKEGSSYSLIA